MLIGDPAVFAIEFHVAKRFEHWVYGSVYYRIGDRVIGDAECETTLNSDVGSFADVLRFRGMRCDLDLYRTEPLEAFHEIDRGIFGIDATGEFSPFEGERAYQQFNATPSTESFDYWKCFVIEEAEHGEARLVWRSIDRNSNLGPLQFSQLPQGEFDRVLASAIAALDKAVSSG